MPSNLITPSELSTDLGNFVVCDVRWKLDDPDHGQRSYEEGHIPGARRVDLDADLSGPAGPRGRHPLPLPGKFAEALGRLGITPRDAVVIYDDAAGRIAARMWWMLQAIGHKDARVLDGGIQQWIAADLPTSREVESLTPTVYPAPGGFDGVVEIDDLTERRVIDAREPERYLGLAEPVDPVAGHIPGAINIPSSSTIENGRLKGPADLRSLYEDLENPVVSCGSGVVACHSALAMTEAGLAMPDVYIGSYSEWSRSGRPVETGTDS